MKKSDSHRFQEILKYYRAESLVVLNRSGQEAREVDSETPQDIGDLSISHVSKESLFQRTNGTRKLVQLIDSALERIKDGNFGLCVSCGDEISLRRLDAVPWTEHCLRCQEMLENGEGVESGPSRVSQSNWRRVS